MIRATTLKIRQGRRVDQARLADVIHRCRVLYNAALQERRDAYRLIGKSPSYYDQCKSLTQIRSEDSAYGDLDVAMTRLTVLDRLDKAFKAFFRRCKAGETPGFPRFKGRDRFDTLIFGTTGWKLTGNRLTVRGVGWFLVSGGKRHDGQIKGLRLVQSAGRWYAHVLVDVGEAPAVVGTTEPVGIDVGLSTFASMSDGTTVENPRFLRTSLDRLATAQQALARKRRGSKARRRAKAVVARVHSHIANQRRDFIHKTSRVLVDKYQGFVVEALSIRNMIRNKHLALSIMDAAWGQFCTALAYKAEGAGKPFVAVNPKGTSQRCSGCQQVVRKDLSVRTHVCPHCGLVLDRDYNAARNILSLGLKASKKAGLFSQRSVKDREIDLHPSD